MSLDPIIENHRDQILALAKKHGAKNLRVFGSVARGEARSDSDIDFLIEADPPTSPFFPGGLVVDLEELLQRPVDVVTEKALHWCIRDQVLKEAKVL